MTRCTTGPEEQQERSILWNGKAESAYQGRSRSARQGADMNSTWRRSLSGAAKHCFMSARPSRVRLAVLREAGT